MKPILFSAPMVQAILQGRKTQTRRVVKPQPTSEFRPTVGIYTPTKVDKNGEEYPGEDRFGAYDLGESYPFTYGPPGNSIWVKETWATSSEYNGTKPTDLPETAPIYYQADELNDWERQAGGHLLGVWRPSIFMRQWMSRITLDITAVRVERLNDISEADALAEGVAMPTTALPTQGNIAAPLTAKRTFQTLWHNIYGLGSWDKNPWVWVIEFQLRQAPKI